jgi:DnaK suppressor protein
LNILKSQVREKLHARRDELTDRLSRIQRDRRRVDDALPADFADQVTRRENDDVLDRLKETTVEELRQVNRAIESYERGGYGFCERCGDEISPARLAAIIDATTCLRCAEAAAPAAAGAARAGA